METLQTIKAFFARLAGAPLAGRPVDIQRMPAQRRAMSGLYAPEPPRDASSRASARTSKQRDGDEGEAYARRYLERSGLTFVAANVRYRDGELDLVMRDPGREARREARREGGRDSGRDSRSDSGRDSWLDSRGPPHDPRRSPSVALLVFVEVRRRAKTTHGGAAASVTREKRRRVVAAAAHYLVGLGQRSLPPCRFDVVTLEGDPVNGFRVEWIRDAFRDDGS